MVKEDLKLSIFEKYLAVCVLLGLFLSQYFPVLSVTINNMQIGGISLPIGICLFLMMYPALLNLQLKELRKLFHNPKLIILTLISNWFWAPLITAFLARARTESADCVSDIVGLKSLHSHGFGVGWSRRGKPGAERH